MEFASALSFAGQKGAVPIGPVRSLPGVLRLPCGPALGV